MYHALLNDVSFIVNNSRDTISFTSLSSRYTAGDSVTVNCTITAYQLSSVITTKVTSYLKHDNIINNLIKSRIFDVTVHTYFKFSLTTFFNNVKLSNAGRYTCTYFLSNNSFVQSSDVKSKTVNAIVKSELVFLYIYLIFYLILSSFIN